MESMFVWIVLFAGAAIALLGVFLVASERELKKKRQEVELLVTKLSDSPTEAATPTMAAMPIAADSNELIELRAKNTELEKELGAAQSKLEMSRRTIEELEADQRRSDATQSNAQWLQTANDQLKSKIEELKNQLQASEAHNHSAASQSQDTTEQQRALEAEVADLHHKLADSMTKNREFEGLQQRLANLESLEASHSEKRQTLENQISQLNREIASGAERLHELDDLRQRLAEADQSRQTLQEERHRFEQELQQWQTRVAEAEEQRNRFAALQGPFNQLAAKHAAMEDRHRDYQEAWVSFSHLLAGNDDATNSSAQNGGHFTAMAPTESSQPVNSDTVATQPTMAIPEQVVAAVQSQPRTKRRFGIFPAVIVLTAAGALTAALWRGQTEVPSKPAASASAIPIRSDVKMPSERKVAATNSLSAATEPTATLKLATREEPKSPINVNNPPAQTLQRAKAETAVGTYETTQASRVYVAPNEFSQQVGDIEPGVKVNVVNAKNGWLEIHSKYGRPPGYIRKEAARLALQN
jgi:hypothetical protein